MDQTASLPDDALAHILRLLPPCDLAASRCVRKAWRDVVDTRRLMFPHILPHSMLGIFVNYIDYERPRFFGRPSSTRPVIDGNLNYLPNYEDDFQPIVDHCNGLLIYSDRRHSQLCVVNPATRRWDSLPRENIDKHHAYLVFDPTVSAHYQVFLLPRLPKKPRKFSGQRRLSLFDDSEDEYDSMEAGIFLTRWAESRREQEEDPDVLMEWPPSSWTLDVFSSSTGQWQERSFIREGNAAGTMADMRLDPHEPTIYGPRWRYGVYWRGMLYVHCRGAFITRLSLSDCKYQVIKAPIDIKESNNLKPYLGKSEKGVYFTAIRDHYHLRVWILDESTSGQISWVLKHHTDIEPWASKYSFHPEEIDKTWILDSDGNKDEAGNNSMPVGENLGWNSDDDNVLNIENDYGQCYAGTSVLGFHPFKEVLFLEILGFQGVAYHLNSSRVQYLGYLRPEDYYLSHSNGIYEAFPYTPCMIGELSIHAED